MALAAGRERERHERLSQKDLEAQRRAEIYALNRLMRKREKARFVEYAVGGEGES